MSTLEIVAVILLAAAGASVQGSVGIGFALVAAPGLVSIDPDFVPGPMLLIGVVVGSRHAIAERADADRRAIRHCLWGLPPGLLAGLVLLEALDDRTMALLVGGLTTAAAIALLSGLSLRRTQATEVAAGAACTFSSVTAGLPGPPLVAAFSDMRPAALRSTASTFILIIAAMTFVSLLATNNFAGDEARLLGIMFPGALLGLLAARYLRPKLERPGFRQVVLVVALLGGLALVVRQL